MFGVLIGLLAALPRGDFWVIICGLSQQIHQGVVFEFQIHIAHPKPLALSVREEVVIVSLSISHVGSTVQMNACKRRSMKIDDRLNDMARGVT